MELSRPRADLYVRLVKRKTAQGKGIRARAYSRASRCNDEIDATMPIIAGTAWAFANPELASSRDVLFVDEAGQISLGNLVAMALSAKSIVLVGDQMQLAQPIQGAHPRDSGRSALDHLLEGHAVVPPERGIFLSKTWRMHPDLCAFVSAAVYEGTAPLRGGLRDATVGPHKERAPGTEGHWIVLFARRAFWVPAEI